MKPKDSFRLFCWRHRKLLAVTYVALLVGICAGLWAYLKRVPPSLEVGAAVAVRSYLYRQTFDEVERARLDWEAGDADQAEIRLERFLTEHDGVQKGQLYTHAVSDAHELLAEVYAADNRVGRATKTLKRALERTPLDYWLWYQLGAHQEGSGDFKGATKSFHEAFKLTLDHPQVASAYLEVLGEQNLHDQALWVHDQFTRAAKRAAPVVTVKVGAPRDETQRKVLDLAGIPVEHGQFFQTYRDFGLARGTHQELNLPLEMFAGAPSDPDPLYLQLRFQNVYDNLVVEGLKWRTDRGRREERWFEEGDVRTMHRDHSGVEFHAEMAITLPLDKLASVTVVYSCPPHELSEAALAVVKKALANAEGRGQG